MLRWEWACLLTKRMPLHDPGEVKSLQLLTSSTPVMCSCFTGEIIFQHPLLHFSRSSLLISRSSLSSYDFFPLVSLYKISPLSFSRPSPQPYSQSLFLFFTTSLFLSLGRLLSLSLPFPLTLLRDIARPLSLSLSLISSVIYISTSPPYSVLQPLL